MNNLKILSLYLCASVFKLSLSIEIEGFLDFFCGGSLVDEDFTYAAEEGEVYRSGYVLLVVLHEGEKFVVVITGEGQDAVVLADVADRLVELVGGESRFLCTEI